LVALVGRAAKGPRRAVLYVVREALAETGRFDEAVAFLEKLAASGDDAFVLELLLETQALLGAPADERPARRLLELAPESPRALWLAANALQDASPDAALPIFEKHFAL